MAVQYVPFNGKLVSREWHVVLRAAAAAGVIRETSLNSGHRTLAEQTRLWLHPPAGTPVVARPSPSVPHVRVGRIDHALDVNAATGAAGRFAAFLRAHGAHPRFTVPGEPWHLELDAGELQKLAARLADPLRGYTAAERRWIREYDQLVRERRDPARRRVLRRVMRAQRKRIWVVAQRSGWDKANRAARYRSLLARTK